MIKHETASTFVFGWQDERWCLGMIEHPRLRQSMIPGGHVEADEHQAEAAVREVREETGLKVRLVAGPAPILPTGFPHQQVPPAWWTTEQTVPPDNHLPEPHVHIDHQYVAVADSVEQLAHPGHPFRWVARDELQSLRMFEDTRILADLLFAAVDTITRPDVTADELWTVLNRAHSPGHVSKA